VKDYREAVERDIDALRKTRSVKRADKGSNTTFKRRAAGPHEPVNRKAKKGHDEARYGEKSMQRIIEIHRREGKRT
jgi:hypothetical protein